MKFSIVTPSFNQAQFIPQTIDSVISQTGDFNIEYFVMDGGSTDNTIKILKKYELQLKNNLKKIKVNPTLSIKALKKQLPEFIAKLSLNLWKNIFGSHSIIFDSENYLE